MIYISFDSETTGLDSEICQIIEFSAIIEDTNNIKTFEEIPKFTRYIKYDKYIGDAYALHMNAHIFAILAGHDKEKQHLICDSTELVEQFCQFLLVNGIHPKKNVFHFTGVGKNIGSFDLLFAKRMKGWKENIQVHQRLGDPATLFTNWHEDEKFPDLATCKKRANIDGIVTHESVYDAWDIITLFRTKYVKEETIINNNENN